MTKKNTGIITQVLGAVVDVRFEKDLPAILSALTCIMPTILAALSFNGVFKRRRVPPMIDARGFRRSWPNTAMNCSRNSDADRSSRRAASDFATRRMPSI